MFCGRMAECCLLAGGLVGRCGPLVGLWGPVAAENRVSSPWNPILGRFRRLEFSTICTTLFGPRWVYNCNKCALFAQNAGKSRFCRLETTYTRWESSNFGCFVEIGRIKGVPGQNEVFWPMRRHRWGLVGCCGPLGGLWGPVAAESRVSDGWKPLLPAGRAPTLGVSSKLAE